MNLSSKQPPSQSLYHSVFIGLLLLTTALYWQGLYGGFIFDDGNSITQNKNIQIDKLTLDNLLSAAFSRETGVLLRPISMASFAFNHALTGLEPFYFKLTNLIIHLGTGLLLLIFLQPLFRYFSADKDSSHKKLSQQQWEWLALTIVAAWLLHPLNLSCVLYAVQRMTSLSAFFVMLGMACYANGRIRMIEGLTGGRLLIVSGLIIPGLLAIFSKENGALLPVFMFVTELTLFQFHCKKTHDKRFLIIFFSLFLFVPALIVICYTLFHPEWILNGYLLRDFTLTDRILSEARILFMYLSQTLFPVPEKMGLFHDSFQLSRGLLDPPSTLFAVVGIPLLILIGFTQIRKQPVIAFGIFWFFAAHLMESTVIALEPVFEHRNYLAIIGPLTILFYLLFRITQKHRSQLVPFIFISVILILFSLVLVDRSHDWSSSSKHIISEVKNHPESSRANDYAGLLYEKIWKESGKDEHLVQTKKYYRQAIATNKNALESLVSLITLSFDPEGTDINRIDIERELLHRLENGIFHPSWISTLQRLIAKTASSERIDIENLLTALTKNKFLRNDDQANVYNLMAINFDKQGDQNKAGKSIKKAVEFRPDNLLYRLGLARWFKQNGQLQSALETLSDAESLPDYIKMKQQVIAERELINSELHRE